MVQSKATTPQEYLAELPEERRKVIEAVRKVVKKNLAKGFKEGIQSGMLSYEIPLSKYPQTYNGKPLMYAALAAQKNYYSLYLMCIYGSGEREAWLQSEFEKAGKKLDMGKSCVRFKKLDDLSLDAIGQAIAQATPEEFIQIYENSRRR